MGTLKTDPMVEVKFDDDGNAVIYRRTMDGEYRVVIPPAKLQPVAEALLTELEDQELVSSDEAALIRDAKEVFTDDGN